MQEAPPTNASRHAPPHPPLLPRRRLSTSVLQLVRRRAVTICGIIALSCVPRSEPKRPDVAPSSTLDIAAAEASKPVPFSVVHAAPQGPTASDPSIFVLFSQTLRPLDPNPEVPPGFTLAPPVDGHWEWMGSHGVTFVPKAGRLPRATAFSVQVPAGLRSTQGEQLAAGRAFEFETPRPHVTEMSPSPWDESVTPTTPILLSLSQPALAEQVAPSITVSAAGTDVPIVVKKGENSQQLRVQAPTGWPLDSKITLSVAPGWTGVDGALSASAHFESSFRTYGPLTATVECNRDDTGRCRPDGGVYLSLSNPVAAPVLARAIRAEGATLRVDQSWSPDSTTRNIDLGVRLTPRQKFTVIIDPITDIYGQALKWIKHRQVEVADYRPAVRVGFSGDSFTPQQTQLGIHARNTGYDLIHYALSADELKRLGDLDSDKKRFALLASLPGARTRAVGHGALNQWIKTDLPLDEVTRHGPFAVGVRYRVGDQTQEEVRWGQRTSLGVTAKLGRDRGHAWITQLDSGAPVAGATVRIVGRTSTATTDAHGLAQLAPGELTSTEKGSAQAKWLEVRKGNEVAYRATHEPIGFWRIPVATDFWGSERDIALLFPERDLFRPGEKAWVKGYVRRPAPSGTVPLANEKLTLLLTDPGGEVLTSIPVQTNDFGAVQTRLEIPGSAKLGYFTVTLARGEDPLTAAGIQVAEYRPSEFEVNVLAQRPSVVAGEPSEWRVEGTYFYGGAMAGAEVETSLRRESAWYSPPGFESYATDDTSYQNLEDHRPYSTYLESDQTVLSAEGTLVKTFAARLDKQVGPERLEFEATVRDLSAQTVSARDSVLVHPASYYPAIQPLETGLVDAPSQLSPKVLAVSPGGQRVIGRPLTLSLYRIRWTHVKQPGSGAASGTLSEPVREPVAHCAVKSATDAQSCALSVPYSGQYILRASSVDEKGRAVASSLDFYAVGPGRAAWRDFDERGVVTLTADREVYQTGETARVLIQSPFERARAWITLERDGVLQSHTQVVSGPSPTISVPITDHMLPNAFVGVHLLEDRAQLGNKAHAIADSYRFGYVELRTDPAQKRLSVDIKADRASYRPRQKVELELTVKNASGRGHPAEVAVFVVDEGVLSLTGYDLPDPLETFLRPRPLRVETVESRESLARVFGFDPNQSENKGDPGGGGDGARSNMLTAAYFNPSVLTDPQGRARVAFELPDNIGRFRIMAVAVSQKDYFGKGRGSITVNQPLMVRPALPRFLRAGDRFEAAATISSLNLPAGKVSVTASAEGAELLGGTQQSVALEQNDGAFIGFPVRTQGVGTATFHFHAQGSGQQDKVALTRPVHSPAQLEVVALYGKTEKADAHRLGDLSNVRKDLGGLDVTLSSTALVGLQGGFEQLWDYPYACSEQLASRALPLLLLRDFATLYGIAAPRDADQRIDRSVAQMLTRQRGDGGFGMWPESPESNPWVSAYVLWVLHEAKQRGTPIPNDVTMRGLRYLRELGALRKKESLSEAVFATLVAGRLGHSDPAGITALYERVSDMSFEAQLLLARAAADAQVTAVADALRTRVEAAITVRGNRAEITAPESEDKALLMGSETRRHAFALEALLSQRPDHPLAAPLVRTILDVRKGDGWESTQAAAFALLALDAYRRAQETNEPDFLGRVFLGDKLLGEKRFLGRSTRAQEFAVEMREIVRGGELTFQQKGAGTLFYEARLRYARTELPQAPLESGFSVRKTMTAVTHNPTDQERLALTDQNEFKHGGLVLVEVLVVAPTQRRYVVVDDPLPAGLEAIDPNLQVTQGSLQALLGEENDGYARAWYRSELRDDRVLYFIDDMPSGVYRFRYLARPTTTGTFVTPPTRALEMYQPEVYGRTASRLVQVQPATKAGAKEASR